MPLVPALSDRLLTVSDTRCWDGKNLDSPDHQSHMFNTVTSEGFTNAPACPASHPIRVPQVTFEVEWDTVPFNSLWDTAKDKNPFVWSYGGVGAGTHADYMFGYALDSLAFSCFEVGWLTWDSGL